MDFSISLRRVRENDSREQCFELSNYHDIQNLTDEDWEQLGRDIANNTHLTTLFLYLGALNDHTMSFLFRGLTRSSSIEILHLGENGFGVIGVRNMVPFLQNANNLTELDLIDNNLQSEGFNMLLRALRDSHIQKLYCNNCGIASIEIDIEHSPRHLKYLALQENSINADGCRALAKLLQGGNATLECLYLNENKIDYDGVKILVDTLQNNTSLTHIDLRENDGTSSRHGRTMLLRLVNDISSIEATLRSNHTLKYLHVTNIPLFQMPFNNATDINKKTNSREAAGRKKVIQTQLHSAKRAELEKLQRVTSSLYSEINPLHLPEVLALVCRHHGQGELYAALKSSAAGVISTVSRKECIRQQKNELLAKVKQLDDELAEIEAAQGGRAEDGESRGSKRRRKWWWGLWGSSY